MDPGIENACRLWRAEAEQRQGERERRRGNEQKVGDHIAYNDAIGVDVAVLFEQIIERLELVKRGWDAEQRSVGSGREK